MKMCRFSLITIFIGLAIAVVCLTISFVRVSDREGELLEKASRLDQECRFVRETLRQIHRHLWLPDLQLRQTGEDMFRRESATEWHEVNVCAPDGVWVGGACAEDDRACMLHIADWGLVVVR